MTTELTKKLEKAIEHQQYHIESYLSRAEDCARSDMYSLTRLLDALWITPKEIATAINWEDLVDENNNSHGWDLTEALYENIDKIIEYIYFNYTIEQIKEAATGCHNNGYSCNCNDITDWFDEVDREQKIKDYIELFTEHGGLNLHDKEDVKSLYDSCLYEYPLADAIRRPDMKIVLEAIYSTLEENGWEEEIKDFKNTDLYAILAQPTAA